MCERSFWNFGIRKKSTLQDNYLIKQEGSKVSQEEACVGKLIAVPTNRLDEESNVESK